MYRTDLRFYFLATVLIHSCRLADMPSVHRVHPHENLLLFAARPYSVALLAWTPVVCP